MMAKRHSRLLHAVIRHGIWLLLFTVFCANQSTAQIWTEDFNSYADATINAPPKWTSYATDCDDGGNINLGAGVSQWGVWAGAFTCNDIEGAPCCVPFGGGGNDNAWQSESINIAGYCNVSISMDYSSVGTFECSAGGPIFACMGDPTSDNGHDQIVAEYSLNAGPWTQFGYVCGFGSGILSAAGLNGNTLQIRVFVANKANAEYYYFDNVVVTGTAAVVPTFTQVGPLCENEASVVLPTTSNQGINGTWNPANFNPAGLGGTTTTVNFTPTAGQCALPTTMDIVVNEPVTPTANPIGPFCTNDPPVGLPTNLGGINGNWSGQGVAGNSFDPMAAGPGNFNLTFTPTSGQCSNTASLSVMVTQAATPNLGSTTLCSTDPLYDLTLLQDPLYPTGTWSGPGVNGTSFNPVGQNGVVNLTFISSANCVMPANTTITVNTATTPPITGVPASICETEAAIPLPTPQGGFAGNWSGQGVTSNNFDPSGLSGSITLTFTPNAGQCANPATTSISVTTPTTPAITGVPAFICETEAAISLPTPQGGFTGNWSGQGVTNNNFDPTGLSGSITLTFTPNAGQCANPASTSISVTLPTNPAIMGVPASICETAVAIPLPTPQGGFAGNWSGQGVTNNSFDPSGLSGSITLTFTPNAGQCANPATTSITVDLSATPMLGTVTLCQDDGLYVLSNLNDPNFPAGTWSGPGVSGGNFNPAGQNGNVTLTFLPSANCVNTATTVVTVNLPIAPALGMATLCQNDSPLALSTLANPSYPAGTWSGPGVSGGDFDPTGQNGNVTLTFSPSANCTMPATTIVTVNTTPSFTALMEPCDPATQTYTVSFTITGGTAPYTVDGTTLAGSTFSSPTIPSGTSYSFVIDDANGCGPVTVSGTQNCSCTTDAGTMDFANAPLTVCYQSGGFSVPFNQDSLLDNNDVLQFVLHDNPGATLGNIFWISNSPVIPIPPGLTPGQTYYVSVIAGNDDGSGNVDLSDPCLSVSQGVPVLFYLLSVELGNDVSICAGDCYEIPLQFTGSAPFGVDYTVSLNGNQVANFFIDNLSNGSTLELCPADFNLTSGVVEIEISGMVDNNFCLIDYSDSVFVPSLNITIGSSVVNNLIPTLCPGEVVVVNGTQYDAANPSGTEVFLGGSASGCDSIVNINLAFYPPASFTLEQSFCGSGSITVNGTVYDQNTPSGIEILQNAAANSCDSTVIVNLTFNQPSVTNLNQTLCTGGSITVNGVVYDEANPSGTEVIIGGAANGCDSSIVVNLSFNSVVTSIINPTLCPGGSVTVNGTTYNAANPSGTETMPGASYLGCDSVAVVGLSFFPPALGSFSPTLCPGGSVTVGGTVFNQGNTSGSVVILSGSVNSCDSTVQVNLQFAPPAQGSFSATICPGETLNIGGTIFTQTNPSGSVVLPQSSYLGCDSTVQVALSFYPVASSTIDDQYCTGGSITVNGTVYNEANPSGTEIILGSSANGCDSTVFVNLTFGSSVIVSLDPTLCAGEVLVVNGTTYSSNNPTGSVTFPNGSYLGCDSTVNVSLSFYPDAVGNITEILQSGGSIVVNGTVYNEQNPSGTEIFVGGSYTGCDSMVVVNLIFEGEEMVGIVEVSSPLCHFGGDGVITLTGIQGGSPPFVVALNGGNSAPVVTFPVVFDNLTFGFHTLTIIDALGNITSQEIFMPDAPELQLDMGSLLTVPLGNSVVLSAGTASQIATWAWSPPDYLDCTDCPTPLSTPLNDILYTLAVTDENGCTAEGELTVLVEKLVQVYVPSAFSPNNDGINDELTVFAGPQVDKIKVFQIFSRWGELVHELYNFSPNDLQLGWNGNFNEKALDPAVFAWFAEVVFLDGTVHLFKGNVTLVK